MRSEEWLVVGMGEPLVPWSPRGKEPEPRPRCNGGRPRVEVPLFWPEILQQACQQMGRVPGRVSNQPGRTDGHLDHEEVVGKAGAARSLTLSGLGTGLEGWDLGERKGIQTRQVSNSK